MVLVEVCPVVVLTTSKTTTSWMLAVLSDTTVTGWDVSTVFSSVGESSRHSCLEEGEKRSSEDFTKERCEKFRRKFRMARNFDFFFAKTRSNLKLFHPNSIITVKTSFFAEQSASIESLRRCPDLFKVFCNKFPLQENVTGEYTRTSVSSPDENQYNNINLSIRWARNRKDSNPKAYLILQVFIFPLLGFELTDHFPLCRYSSVALWALYLFNKVSFSRQPLSYDEQPKQKFTRRSIERWCATNMRYCPDFCFLELTRASSADCSASLQPLFHQPWMSSPFLRMCLCHKTTRRQRICLDTHFRLWPLCLQPMVVRQWISSCSLWNIQYSSSSTLWLANQGSQSKLTGMLSLELEVALHICVLFETLRKLCSDGNQDFAFLA